MVSFKALCLVGVASLVATSALSNFAFAADLLQLPPPPPVYAPPPANPLFGGGVYLRGDVGIGAADLRTKDSSFEDGFNAGFGPGGNGIGYNARSLDDSGFVDAGVGYRVNQYFRADVTGEYRTSSHFSATESYNDVSQPSGRQYDIYNGEYRSIVGLLNGYVDLGTWWCVTPFFGAGVGVANVSVKNMYDTSPNGGFGTASDHSQNNFAYALMAGLDFAVTQNLKLEIGYRYLDMGNVSSGTFECVNFSGPGCQEVQHSHLASNDIRLGFRYTFADYAPAPQPVIARY